MAKRLVSWCLFFLLFTLFFGDIFSAQGTCKMAITAKNAYRHVIQDIDGECPGDPPHTVPWGNWGVSSNYGSWEDGHQFQGWCMDHYACDNYNVCAWECLDGWLEWNSCTVESRWEPPNSYLYNYANYTEQYTATYVNTVDSIWINRSVDCPRDTNMDGICDTGGCDDVSSVTASGNFMTIYELDLWSPDRIQSLYYESITVYPACGPFYCNEVSSAAYDVDYYSDPSNIQRVAASLGISVNSSFYIDSIDCEYERFGDQSLQCSQ